MDEFDDIDDPHKRKVVPRRRRRIFVLVCCCALVLGVLACFLTAVAVVAAILDPFGAVFNGLFTLAMILSVAISYLINTAFDLIELLSLLLDGQVGPFLTRLAKLLSFS